MYCYYIVVQAKRRLLQSPNGFKSKFYNVSEILTPSLAWAFFGPDQELASLANEFKEQVRCQSGELLGVVV